MGLFSKAKEKSAKLAEKASEVIAEAAEKIEAVADVAEEKLNELSDKAEEKAEQFVAEMKEKKAAEEAPEAAPEVTKAAPAAPAEEASVEAPAAPAAEAPTAEEVPAAPAEEPFKDDKLFVIDHPLVQHKLTIMRDINTGAKDFRELLGEIAMLVGYEVTRDLPLCDYEIETPLQKMTGKAIAGKKLAIVPILRAGLGMVDGLLSLVPAAKVGHIGLYRDPETHEPVEYYCKLPDDIENRLVIVTDPMLATGGSATDAVRMIKEKGCTDIRLMCLVSAPEGIKAFHAVHPDVPVFTAALDERLNDKAYILPGLGDAGDRIFGT